MKKEIQKNLYDLEYNKILNYQNMILILIGTLIIGFILSNYSLKIKLIIIISVILIGIFLLYSFGKKLKEIKSKIESL